MNERITSVSALFLSLALQKKVGKKNELLLNFIMWVNLVDGRKTKIKKL